MDKRSLIERDLCTKQALRSASMSVKFSEDVVPLTDLKVNPGRVVNTLSRPIGPYCSPAEDAGSPSCGPWPTTSRPRRSAPSCAS